MLKKDNTSSYKDQIMLAEIHDKIKKENKEHAKMIKE